MTRPWFTPVQNNSNERRLAAIIAHNGPDVLHLWSARCCAVRNFIADPCNCQRPKPVTAEVNIEGRRGTMVFLPNNNRDTLVIMYGKKGYIKATNAGQGYLVSDWIEDY